MSDEHCGDDAELYALGMLAPERRADIETHARSCGACSERIVAAETAAAALADLLPSTPPAADERRFVAAGRESTRSSRLGVRLAVAAALIFACASGVETVALQHVAARAARTDRAMSVIASSHFNHTTLNAAPGSAAKVLYARDGSWLFVVANGLAAGVRVDVVDNGARRTLGELAPGAPATLFVAGTGKVGEVLLVADGRVVARGSPSY